MNANFRCATGLRSGGDIGKADIEMENKIG